LSANRFRLQATVDGGRQRAWFNTTKTDELLLDPNYDFDLEPASLWSSFVHASLHYARLTWDLSPVGHSSQASVHS